MLENTVGAIKNGQSRETGNIGYTRQRKTKKTTQYVLETTMRKQTQVTLIKLLQRTGGKDELNIVFMRKP
jgi:hypothetical protein